MGAPVRIAFDEPLDAGDVAALFAQTDWACDRSVDDVRVMLDADSFHVSAWADSKLVGFLRVLSDRRFRAFIEDVIVDAEYRGQGVGDAMMRRALETLAPVQEVVLGCTEDNVGYYARHGFTRVGHATMQRKTS
ncbi:MAG: GNAT family N-acetyltransferase [Pseudomonadota bacterium]